MTPAGQRWTREGYWLHEWWDETSQFDPNGVWFGGVECYQVKYRMLIPISISPDDDDAINAYIEQEWERLSHTPNEAT